MKVTLCNFRCFKALKTYEFANAQVNLLMGPSGAGKSTVLEAIRWCLYGNLRGIYPSGFTPSATNKTYVTVELSDLKITRSQAPEQLKVVISSSGNRFTSDNLLPEEGKEKELIQEAAQQYIDGRFGNKNTWLASSFIRQGERCPLMVANNTERMTLLNEILFGNDNTSQYENPDFYTEKIEEEIDKIEKRITGETAIFNSNYHKYVSVLNSFENTYGWSKMDLETIADYEMYCNRTEHRKKMLEKELLSVQNLENRKRMLEERLLRISDGNSMTPISESVITELKSQISQLNTEILSNKTKFNTLMYNLTKVESLTSELSSLQSKFDAELAEQNPRPIRSSELTSLKNEYRRVQNDELQVKNLEFQLNSLSKEKESLDLELLQYSELGTDVSRISKLITHSVSMDKYNSLVEESEKFKLKIVDFKITLSEIPSKRRELETLLFNIKQVNEVCTRYGISHSDMTATLNSVNSVIEFSKLQRVHLSRKSIIDTLKSQIQSYEANLKEETGTSSELEEEIKLITSRLGSPLKCPGCACKLEYRNNGLFLIGNEIIDRQEGMRRIEALKEQLKIHIENQRIRLTIDTLKHKLEVSEPYEETYTSASVSYTPEQIAGYERLVKDLERVSDFTTDNSRDETKLKAELEQLNSLEKYYKLQSEVETLKATLDESLNNQTSLSVEELRKALTSIPLLLSRKSRLEDNYNSSMKSLTEIRNRLGTLSSAQLFNSISELEAEMTEAEQFNKTLETHKLLKHNIERLMKEILALNVNSSEIEELRTSTPKLELSKTELENQVNKLTLELTKYREFVALETELKSIVIRNSSETLLRDLENLNREMKTYEDMLRKSKEMYELYKQQTELEGLHSSLTTLTNNQTNLNALKNLIVEVSNSTLQSLVDTINNTTNTILEELFDNSIVVELKLYKEMKTKHKVKPLVNISVYYNGNVYDNVNSLSGGEKDRVSLAMTLALATIHTSPVVFLDECMSALDSSLREECLETIKKFLIETNSKTVINIEHGSCGMYDNSVMV